MKHLIHEPQDNGAANAQGLASATNQQPTVEVKVVPLDSITVSSTNGIFRQKHELTKEALSELVESIKQHGVIQPVLVRPDKTNEGKFILICGERRYRASLIAGKSQVPAYIKDVTDEIALILQITENIQREGVHPLNEAKGYRLMMEADEKLRTAELALQFGKSETYIIQRLKLNDLVRDAKKDFYESRMHLGHAILICRLQSVDQKEIIARYADRNGYGTVLDLESYILRNVTNNLSAAPFDEKDEELYKKAGSCLACPKRSGSSPLLFAEIKQKDQCFDRACFFAKCDLFLVHRTRKAIETEPDLALLMEGYQEPNEKISKMIEEHKIKPLKQYDDFNTYETGGTKIKGLWITGNHAGHLSEVYLKKTAKAAVQGVEGIPVQIEKIKQRIERNRELDGEKVYAKILEALTNHVSQKRSFNKKMIPDEEVMLWFIILDKAGYHIKSDLLRVLGISKDNPEKIYQAIRESKPEDKAYILRRVMLDQYGGNYPTSSYGFIVQKIAAGYGDIDIKGFEKEQQAICAKREMRANERIVELRRVSKGIEKTQSTNGHLKRAARNKSQKGA
jgi:ParB/RepB/Spo0J family partition protein